MKRKLLFLFAAAFAICSINTSIYAVTDISGHWAEGIINFFIDNGFIAGYNDNAIKPENNMTKAEFYSFVNRLFNLNETKEVSFVNLDSEKWYYEDILKAVAAGYIDDGAYAHFDDDITREEAAAVICKVLKLKQNENAADHFKDSEDISSWAKGYVGAVYEYGVVKGSTDGCFYPVNNMKRAEVFAILKGAYDYSLNNAAVAKTEVSTEITTQTENQNKAKETFHRTTTDSYKIPSRVTDVKQWEKAIRYAMENLYDVIELEIENFNETTYNLENLNITNIGITASGNIKNNVGYIKYEFSYERENYKLIRTIENPSLKNKLNNEENYTLDSLRKITLSITNSKMTDFEKEIAIHDYIAGNYLYPNEKRDEYYSVVGAMKTNTAYCDAAATMFYIMGSYAGLNVGFVEGALESQNHLWNYIVIDGKYYHVDITADLTITGEKNYGMTYHVFNVPDDWIKGQYKWKGEKNNNIKCTSVDANYYYMNNLVFKNEKDLVEYLEKIVVDKPDVIMFYTDGFEFSEDILNGSSVPKYVQGYLLGITLDNCDECKILIPQYR